MDTPQTSGPSRAIRVIAVIAIVATLSLARDLFVPLALAILLAFLLQPAVARLCRLGLPRMVAAILAVLLACAVTGGIGTLVGRQFFELSRKLPEYRENLRHRADAFRTSSASTLTKISSTIKDINREISTTQPAATSAPSAAKLATGAIAARAAQPVQVEVVNDGPNLIDIVSRVAMPIFGPITEMGAILLLLIFLLLHYNDLRERLIWLAGRRQISLTTAALDEVGQRIGSYLRMQLAANLCYGAIIALGLSLLGLPSSLFWGVTACILRFIPFLGVWLAGIPSILLAIAVFPDWARPIGVAVTFAIAELNSSMFLEPWLFGRSSGISSLGIVCAVIFWAWLWGPVGMILAVPLTVCLMGISKQIPELSLLYYLFGDAVEVPKSIRLYQRLIVGDDVTAGRLIHESLHESTFSDVCQTLIMPVLQSLKCDRQAELIDRAQARRALSILDEATKPSTAIAETDHPALLCVAVDNDVDDFAATLLARAAVIQGVQAATVSSRALASEVVEEARRAGASAICLVQIMPGPRRRFRQLAKMLAANIPDACMIAANIDPSSSESPFNVPDSRLPIAHRFHNVPSLMARLCEICSILNQSAPSPPALRLAMAPSANP
jgi:predicted PurR-regulated permease PerM